MSSSCGYVLVEVQNGGITKGQGFSAISGAQSWFVYIIPPTGPNGLTPFLRHDVEPSREMLVIENHSGNLQPVAPRGIGWQALGPAIAWTAIATLALAARLYTRSMLMRSFGNLEDVLITAAMVSSLGILVAVSWQFHLDSNLDGKSSSPETTTKLLVAGQCFYFGSISLVKGSLIATYLHVFRGDCFKALQIICYFILPCLLGNFCYAVFGGIFLCKPVAKLWLPEMPGQCDSSFAYFVTSASTNIALDVLVWLLPVYELRTLRLPRSQLFGVLLVFVLGAFTCVVGILRLALTVMWAQKGHYSRSGRSLVTWSSIEANTAITCASLLTIKPLVRKYFPSLLVSSGVPSQQMNLQEVVETDPRRLLSSTWQTVTTGPTRASSVKSMAAINDDKLSAVAGGHGDSTDRKSSIVLRRTSRAITLSLQTSQEICGGPWEGDWNLNNREAVVRARTTSI